MWFQARVWSSEMESGWDFMYLFRSEAWIFVHVVDSFSGSDLDVVICRGCGSVM